MTWTGVPPPPHRRPARGADGGHRSATVRDARRPREPEPASGAAQHVAGPCEWVGTLGELIVAVDSVADDSAAVALVVNRFLERGFEVDDRKRGPGRGES